MLHELGHVIGLDDLYDLPRDYPGYLMYDPYDAATTPIPSGTPTPITTIPTLDQGYLDQVYRQHGGERHGP